jgi:hypothetical protein
MFSTTSSLVQGLTHFAYVIPGTGTNIDSFTIGYIVVRAILGIVVLISLWHIFKKAGQKKWAAIIPVYNYIVLLRVVGRPWWWIFFLCTAAIPYYGGLIAIGFSAVVLNDLSKSFRKDFGMTVALFFVVGFPVLAFGKAKYHGPAALKASGTPAPRSDAA